jgi:ATP-binding cassette, subfamily F, member 3
MGELEPLAGCYRFGSQVKPGYMSQEHQNLSFIKDPFSTISSLSNKSETEVRRFLSYFLFTNDEVFTPVTKLSYGERSRLSLACLVVKGANFLLLDEPTNHLDIPSRIRFEQALDTYNGTALIITHDRYFIDRFATEIWEMAGQNLRRNIVSKE